MYNYYENNQRWTYIYAYRHSEENLKMETERRAADYDVGSNFKFKKTKYYSNY